MQDFSKVEKAPGRPPLLVSSPDPQQMDYITANAYQAGNETNAARGYGAALAASSSGSGAERPREPTLF